MKLLFKLIPTPLIILHLYTLTTYETFANVRCSYKLLVKKKKENLKMFHEKKIILTKISKLKIYEIPSVCYLYAAYTSVLCFFALGASVLTKPINVYAQEKTCP